MKIGSTLPNGNILLAIYEGASTGIVLALVRPGEYVTHEFYRGDLRTTSTGHYIEDKQAAVEDFRERVGRILNTLHRVI